MLFNSGLTILNFASQSGLDCSFSIDRFVSPLSSIKMGLSGSSSYFATVSDSIIYDTNNKSIYSLNYQDDTLINFKISSGVGRIFINEKPYSQFEYSGLSDNLIVSGDRSLDIGISLSGEPMSIEFNTINQFTTGHRVMTGVLTNNSYPRTFKVTGINILSESDSVLPISFPSGNISNSGIILFSGISGKDLPSGDLSIQILTNYKSLNYTINSSPPEEVIQESYLKLSPESFFLNFNQNQDLTLESYFNYGNTRNLYITLEKVSVGYYTPQLTNFTYTGSGNLSGLISGSGQISGNITGTFSGETGITGYSEAYVFTGFYSESGLFVSSGISNSGISSGEIVSGYLPFSASGVLTSGDSGRFTGFITGITTGDYYEFSGYINQAFSFGSKVYNSGVGASGFSGSATAFGYHLRSRITGLNFVVSITGATLGLDEDYAYLGITDWIHKTGVLDSGVTGYKSEDNESYLIGPDYHFSGISGSDLIYTGVIPYGNDNFNDKTLHDLVQGNMSGYMNIFIFSPVWVPFADTWGIRSFYFTNFPVDYHQSVTFSGSGYYNHAITGNINEFKSGLMTTGIIYSSGQPEFEDVWNLKTGLSDRSFLDFKYYNKINLDKYENSGSYAQLLKNKINSIYLNIDHNGNGLSGTNVASLEITDGFNSLTYNITGYGE